MHNRNNTRSQQRVQNLLVSKSLVYNDWDFFVENVDDIQQLYDRLRFEVEENGIGLLDGMSPESFAQFVMENSTIRQRGSRTRSNATDITNRSRFEGPQIFIQAGKNGAE